MKRFVAATGITAALIAIGATGCGGDSSDTSSGPASPEDVALSYWNAYAEGDGAGMCDEMSADFFGTAGADSCAQTAAVLAERGDMDSPEVTDSQVNGETAKVTVTGSQGVTYVTDMLQEDGEWRVDNAQQK